MGAFLGSGLWPMTGLTILGTKQIDVNVNAAGPLIMPGIVSVPILPGNYWSSNRGSNWQNGISFCTQTNSPCYPVQYYLGPAVPSCTVDCQKVQCNNLSGSGCNPNAFPRTYMDPDLERASGQDPIANGFMIGSGPWECISTTSQILGVGCSSTGDSHPPAGGSYVLRRFGKGLAPASSVSGIYFRSNGNLAAYLWSQDTGDITHDFLNFSVVASCFGAAVTSTGPCAHFQRGIGANGGPISVGLSQVSIVNRFVGLNWVAPFVWATTPPLGIIPLAPVLYENTITLNPASVAGCTTAYPIGGYDC
ncbi:MAG TPA: hypothetical protein VK667_03355, partial [Ktedonobacteraceae bacterium]|nr:hypothetical protein [Ktedonobacteraceae bacterium]